MLYAAGMLYCFLGILFILFLLSHDTTTLWPPLQPWFKSSWSCDVHVSLVENWWTRKPMVRTVFMRTECLLITTWNWVKIECIRREELNLILIVHYVDHGVLHRLLAVHTHTLSMILIWVDYFLIYASMTWVSMSYYPMVPWVQLEGLGVGHIFRFLSFCFISFLLFCLRTSKV